MIQKNQNWYQINNIDELDSPALVIYVDRVKENIQKLINGIDDINRLRPHVKTHKSIEVTKLLLEAGINKFKCATIAEAEMLAKANCKDILLAYQPFGPKLLRFIKLQLAYPNVKLACLVDNLDSAKHFSEIAKQNGVVISIYIDLNVGMDRTGIKPAITSDLYEEIAKLKNVNLLGLHAYDGHIHEIDMAIRTKQCNEIYAEVSDLKNNLLQKGFKNVNLVMGGSPSFPIYSKFDDVECSPGTFVYWDQNYHDGLPEQDFLHAALVIGRIISIPTHDTVCVDIGHKSISAEYDLQHRIQFLNAPDLKPISQSEEHLVLSTDNANKYKIGDVLYGLPFHICPTCALYENANIIKDHNFITSWKNVARDRILSI